MAGSHSTRAARNESIFRSLNEELGASASGSGADVNGFVCECANIACTAVLAVPVLIHNAIRTGNPVYPLANGLFRSPYWNEAAADHLSDFGLGSRSILDGLWLAVIAPLSWSLDAVRHRALYGLAPALLLILFLN